MEVLLIGFGKIAAEQAVGVAIGFAGRYSMAIFKRSVRKELRKAMLSALVSAAPAAEPEDEPSGRLKRGWHRATKAAKQFRARGKRKKLSKGLLKAKQIDADSTAIAGSAMKAPREDWRELLSEQLRNAATQGVDADDDETKEAWHSLVGQSQDIRSWAETVATEFALQIRSRKELEFLVAQLDDDQQRARLVATTAAISRVSNALLGVSISLLIGASGLILTIALQ